MGKVCFEAGYCLVGSWFDVVWDLAFSLGLGGFLVLDLVDRGHASVGGVPLALDLLSRGC